RASSRTGASPRNSGRTGSSPNPIPTPTSSTPYAACSGNRRRWRGSRTRRTREMTRRKLIAAALFFTIFGVIALLPPLVLLFRFDARIAGVPVETVYVFALWALLVAGARWFSRALPDDMPTEN